MNESIPEEIKEFILSNIDSIAEWECVLLLRADPAKEWDAAAIARSLYMGKQEAVRLLMQLSARHMVALSETEGSVLYHYSSPSAETERIIGLAAESYRRHLIPITSLIHSKSKTRIQQFADAFKLRKD